ncbi:winged helix-turn-helix transcriptional regulator [Haladaptatus salinisoli]|uniref:winged helix-turn-helix transcriptional regulator n=1 Tax=Haladaptatus salinisoli TaxID=2884876 RepID=UPI001D0B3B57|nr:helix-turn-helix domain-containing protein [Haladaptatus salinisoli]
MVEPPIAEEFVEAILSNETPRKPGSQRAQEDNRTMTALLNLLGKKHTIAILHQFAMDGGPLRYSDLEDAIDIAPNTLTTRLKELTDVGLLTREAYNEIPPRVEYQSTEKARDLAPVFWYLGVWTERHNLESASSHDSGIDESQSE